MSTSSPRSYESEIRRLKERIDRLERSGPRAPRMRELTDAAPLSQVQDGQIPVYRIATGLWHPEDQSGGGGGGDGVVALYSAKDVTYNLALNIGEVSWSVSLPVACHVVATFGWWSMQSEQTGAGNVWGYFDDTETENIGQHSGILSDISLTASGSAVAQKSVGAGAYTASMFFLGGGQDARAWVSIIGYPTVVPGGSIS